MFIKYYGVDLFNLLLMLVFVFLLGISQILLCSISAPQVRIVCLSDDLHVPMLFGGTYSELKLFLFIAFYIVFFPYY
jgi:hypothetical protein